MKLTSTKARELLLEGVIYNTDDLEKPENRWVKHCLYVGIAAGRIAKQMGLDDDYAIALGYIHDIGRKISHPNHTIEGYKYMIEKGYPEEARSCLTHSFIDNNILYTAGGGPDTKERYDFVNDYLHSVDLTEYDNIIQLCDLFCLETGFTTVERRLLDITQRKGVFSNSELHFTKTLELKERLEMQMGCSLYDLFPEISEECLNSVEKDREEILNIFKNFGSEGNNQVLSLK